MAKDKIKLDKRNYRLHPEKNKNIINKSLQDYGAGRSILIDSDGTVIAGNGVFEQAEKLDIPVQVIENDGKTLIAIKRTDLKEGDTARKMLAIADNKSSDESSFDFDLLTSDFDIDILNSLGFDPEQISDYYETEKDGQIGDDEIPEEIEPMCKPGDLFQLGDHRLMCGDSTKKADVQKLMGGETADLIFTDPPYGVSYEGTNHEIIKNDDLRGDALYQLLNKAFKNLFEFSKANPAVYVWHASRTQMIFETALIDAGFEVKEQLIWNKGMSLGRSDYHWAHEPCFYVRKAKVNNQWYGDRKHKTILREKKTDLTSFKKSELIQILTAIANETTTWEIKKDKVQTYVHPTQKPVDLCIKAMQNNTIIRMKVLDLFLGSGSTLIAAEKVNRKCYGMELDPHYADVIITRWQEFTGKKAQRL